MVGHLYFYTTRCSIEDILDCRYYKDNQKDWLKSMRLDYMYSFVRKIIFIDMLLRNLFTESKKLRVFEMILL